MIEVAIRQRKRFGKKLKSDRIVVKPGEDHIYTINGVRIMIKSAVTNSEDFYLGWDK